MSRKISNFKKLYYEPGTSSYLTGSASILYREYTSQNLKPPIKLEDAEQYLSGQAAYTINRRAIYDIKTNPICTEFIGDVLAIDLAEMASFSKDNRSFKYIFCAIDTFSKKGYAVPLLDKTAKRCLEALKKVLSQSDYRVYNICVDNGSEFKASFEKFCNKKSIKLYRVQGHQKNAIAERFIRTLKEKLWRFFRMKGVTKWVAVLPKIVDAYNKSPHRSIKMPPNSVNNANSHIVYKNLYPKPVVKKPSKFKLGDIVKFSKTFNSMQKSYEGRWSLSTYRIKEIKYPPSGSLPMYRLEEARTCKPFDGYKPYWWYGEDLQKVDAKTFASEDTLYDIQVLKKKSKGKYSLIKFLDYPDAKTEWVKTNTLVLK